MRVRARNFRLAPFATRVRSAAVVLAAAGFLAFLPSRQAAGGTVDIVGAWYVLIHYTDDHSAHPERERWSDRVWVFERSGSRLKWREYTIVIFDDDGGRFERRASGQYARVLHAWEPSEAQLADIRGGLQVNDRGSKQKTLHGSDAQGWKSKNRARPGSASIITYTETWSIDGLPLLPVFERLDVMGGSRTDTLDGVTRYAATRVLPSGNRLSGTYVRDGVRHGTFRMRRTARVEGLKKAAKTQAERNRRAFEQQGPDGAGSGDGADEGR